MRTLALVSATAALFLASTTAHAAKTEPAPAGAAAPADAPPKAKQPRYKGTGLLVTTGIIGATTLSIAIARHVMLKKDCPLDGASAGSCNIDTVGTDLALGATTWGLNLANVGVAAGAGVMLGRWHAWKDSGTGKKRNANAIMGAGGGVLGVGVIGLGVAAALPWVMPAKCLAKETSGGDALAGDRCWMKVHAGFTMTHWFSFAMIASGAAMLGYGAQYKRRSERLASLQVTPYVSRGMAGIGLGGRF